jgi:hypothetical protein
MLLLTGIATLASLVLGTIIFTNKKQKRVKRAIPQKNHQEILNGFIPTSFEKILINFSYKGSKLQAILSDILIMDGKEYLLGVENTTAIRIFTVKDIKEVNYDGKQVENLIDVISKLPSSPVSSELFSAQGKVETKELRAKLESMQPALEALNALGGYSQSPLEIYLEKYN